MKQGNLSCYVRYFAKTMSRFCMRTMLLLLGVLASSLHVSAQTTTFSYTGGAQTYTVPAGMTVLTVDLAGGAGGNSFNGYLGGLGGRVQATIAVTPGEVLQINIGQKGPDANVTLPGNPGGYNGGGQGTAYGGSGGGASDIRVSPYGLADRIIVAGGGGGAANFYSNDPGGAGGGLTGNNGTFNGSYTTTDCGAGGTQVSGGAGATSGGAASGSLGSAGTSAHGGYFYYGFFGTYYRYYYYDGGGGGGGYYGGGGGQNGSGGGGSSYYGGAGVSGASTTSGFQSGDGSVAVTPSGGCPPGSPSPAIVAVTGGGGYCSGGTGVAVGLAGSAIGVSYQLYLGGSPVGSPVAGVGSALSFGLQTTAGTYTATATNTFGCTANMSGSANIVIYPLPNVYSVTGGGSFCAGGTGVVVGLSGSDVGINYQLYRGGLPVVGTITAGTGAAISFGLQMTPGVYTVVAKNAGFSGCTNTMSGSATITVNALPTVYSVTGGGSYCTGGTGVHVGLSNSDVGVNYQLYIGGVATGSPVAGTGIALDFGLETTAGTYTVGATNATTSCTNNMSGSARVSINPLPTVFSMAGGGGYCVGGSGVNVGLSNSTYGVNYQLYIGGVATGTPVGGTGAALSFGLQTAVGTYTATATNATTGCFNNMSGSVTVSTNPLPNVYVMTGGGTYCAGGTGVVVGLASSDVGVDYQLYRGGTTAVGGPVGGTGAAISFGLQTIAGTYTVKAYNVTTRCSASMSGSATITSSPLPIIMAMTGGGTYCTGGSGVHVGLASSTIGINYQLYVGGIATGSPVAGTGIALDFGLQTTAGTYTATATNPATGCTDNMSGSAIVAIAPLPTVYSVTGGGSFCAGGTGVVVGLSGSTLLTNYQLYRGGVPVVGTITAGTGAAISFGYQTVAGTYTVVASNGSACTNTMSGSATVVVNPLPTAYNVTGTGSYCAGGTGVALGLSNSDLGVNYQLYLGFVAMGSPVAGTGAAISFGMQTTAGTYTVKATNTTTGCINTMTGSATVSINPLPAAFTVTGGGGYCIGGTGVLVGLAGSTYGTNYQLYNGASPVGSPVAGTGTGLSFGLQTATGTYTVVATNTTTGCTNNMSGSVTVTINPLPTAYAVTGGGGYCAGGTGLHVGLASSDLGVLYQLYRSGSGVGAPHAGTGSALDFGIQTAAGTYTVIATTVGSLCTNNMTGSVTITINPLPTAYAVTGTGGYCAGGTGLPVGLANSDLGINYQLYLSGVPLGSPVAGTGSALSFGLETTGGTYTVVATDGTTGCVNNMTGSAVITVDPLPGAYSVTGGGGYCSGGRGVLVGLSGSDAGVSYQLYNGGTPTGTAVTGTGLAITFGLQTSSGTYTVVATNPTTTCTNNMSGSATVTINSLPNVYSVTGGGDYCAGGTGVTVGVSNSDAGVNYQLYRTGVATGSPVAGTGSAVSFGSETVAGTYTVVATDATSGCTSNMTGSAIVTIDPLPAVVSMTGGGAYCTGGFGVHVGLTASSIGINYQLYLGGVPVGSPVSGSGVSLDFGLQTAAGTYTATATNPITGCTSTMSGSETVYLYSLPSIYSVTGGGSYCAGGTGITIGVSGSDIGVNYQLYLGGSPIVGAIVAGTGTAISFGTRTAGGTYTVVATTGTSGCTNTMSGSATITVNPLPNVYAVTGGGGYCTGGTGVTVGLSNSDLGINYQLYVGTATVGSPVAGSGSALSFGLQTTTGTYTVVATDASSGCASNMYGTAIVTTDPLPTAFTVTGGGGYCSGGAGATVGLSNSTAAVSYQLMLGGVPTGTPVMGTGAAISFGPQSGTGVYTVVATNTVTGCVNTMTGSVTVSINPLPTVYTMTGGGTYCAGGVGVAVGLASSDAGINYQLYRGTSTIGGPTGGTGAALSFGLQTYSGTYVVVARNPATGCTDTMSGSAVIVTRPLPAAVAMTGGGGYCAGGTGVHIGLASSAVGVNYQLWLGTTPVGSPVSGTGIALDFGLQTTAGTYTATATDPVYGCVANMLGSETVTIYALPTVYSITGGGSFCTGGSGVTIGLTGSQLATTYQLYRGGSPVLRTIISGTGAAISFGAQTTGGTYQVVATSGGGCTDTMAGSTTVTVNPLPTADTVTGGGAYCAGGTGVHIGLNTSTSGVNYQLYRGTIAVGSAIAGTGSPLDFGLVTTAGTYSVVGTDATTGCVGNMANTVTITINSLPAAFTVTGGGGYCIGGSGVSIGLSGSVSTVSYQLYNGTTPVGSPITGTGTGISFGLQTVAGTYTVVGTNTITGCTNTMSGSAIVTINSLPTAYLLTGGGGYCSGGTGVNVGVASSAIGVHYQLYRGGVGVGSPISGTGAAISFGLETVAGSYSVIATTVGSLCSSGMLDTVSVTVNPLPTAYAVTGGGAYCTGGRGDSIGVANSQVGVNYQLFRGTTAVGSTVAGTGSAITFGLQTTAGTYTVVATDAITGCSNNMTGSAIITVISAPTAYTVTGGGAYCSGGTGRTIGLSGSQAGVSYQLMLATSPVGSALIGSGGALTFGMHTVSGTYTVVATVVSGGCTATMTGSATITVNPLPTVDSVTGGGSYCSGGSGVAIGLNGSTSGVNYQLMRGTTSVGSHVAGTGSSISFGLQTTAGTYTVVATNATSGCTSNMAGSAVITVSALPATVTVTGGGGYCSGGSGVHVGLAASAVGTSYQLWRGGTTVGSALAGTGLALDFGLQTTAGTYTVTATNGSSCTATMSGSATVYVYSNPTVYTITGGGSYCAGGTGVTVGLSNSNSGTTYRLYASGTPVGSTLSGTGLALSFGNQTIAGTYTIIATNSGTGCTSTMYGSVSVSVNPNPSISGTIYTVAPTHTITLTGSISGGTWSSSNTAVATVGPSTGIVSGVSLGTTVITYTLTTGCYDHHIVSVTSTGHREAGTQTSVTGDISNITVAPNPNHGSFTVKGSLSTTEDQQVTLSVTNMLGQVVYTSNITARMGELNETVQLNGSLPNGMYLLSIRSDEETKVVHIVVEQ